MKYLILILSLLYAGCSTGPTRKTEEMDKWTAPEMRVAVYSPDLDAFSSSQIQSSLLASGKFWIVSRGQALEAIFSEQEITHKDFLDRFEDKEKWAHWGKLHGVGAIILAQSKCQDMASFGGSIFQKCSQILSMLDSSTGELIASAASTAEGDIDRLPPSWDQTTELLVKRIPKFWIEKVFVGRAAERQLTSIDHSKYMREKHSKKTSKSTEQINTAEQDGSLNNE